MENTTDSDRVLMRLLADCSDEACEIVMAVRQLMATYEPLVKETIRKLGISYHKPTEGGFVKGGIGGIDPHDGGVRFKFIHGAFLPDPARLLTGDQIAMRHLMLRSMRDVDRPAFKALIRAAVAFKPGEDPAVLDYVERQAKAAGKSKSTTSTRSSARRSASGDRRRKRGS